MKHKGKVARPRVTPKDLIAGVNATANLVGEVVDVVRVCAECAREIGVHRTERARIEHQTRVRLEAIRSQRELMIMFLDKTFAERRENFRELFEQLDTAMAKDDPAATRAVLDSLVSYAKSSPFEALRDAATAHEALQDKNIVWEF